MFHDISLLKVIHQKIRFFVILSLFFDKKMEDVTAEQEFWQGPPNVPQESFLKLNPNIWRKYGVPVTPHLYNPNPLLLYFDKLININLTTVY